ncbi:MAG: DNA polymerase III subunit gamma/tau [Clostridiales bacterium]|nr:DNA polymerase III subunit gamma/tau [Clostridiales bacterium]
MAYMALYRKWRPMTFDEVVEQDAVVTVLRNAVRTGRIAHAYLFCGTRGTGKTTMAKIFARAVNCLNPQNGNPCNECDVCRNILTQQILDVSEIDAASNNGVDNIRSIIEETAFAASVAKYKVFIIDEVHMLSSGAFNALLKTLEEPPQDVIFILATTEPNKLPVTILSRCQRYDFKRISQNGIIGRLETICKDQNLSYEFPALAFLAQKSDGALRDAISLLDQTLASCGDHLTLAAARAATGSIDKEFIEKFAFCLIKSEGGEILRQIAVLFSEGRDPSDFIGELMQIYRNILVLLTVKDPEGLLYETDESMKLLHEIAAATNTGELTLIIKELSKLDSSLKWAVQRKILFEAGMLSICDRKWDASEASFSERIAVLERRLSDIAASGIIDPNTAARSRAELPEKVREEVLPQPKEPERTNQIKEIPSKQMEIKNMPKAGGLRESDELDWKDFLTNISAKGQASLSALVKLNSRGVLDGKGNLILVFASPIVKDMIVKKDATEILSESATSAYGMPLRVIYATKNDPLDQFQPAQCTATPSSSETAENDGFDHAVNLLKEISKQEGFQIENK